MVALLLEHGAKLVGTRKETKKSDCGCGSKSKRK